MNLRDALYNWLQMRIVADARPDDRAALDTLDFFEQILTEDHGLTSFGIAEKDDSTIQVRYEAEEISKLMIFDREETEKLLADIRSNPKYN